MQNIHEFLVEVISDIADGVISMGQENSELMERGWYEMKAKASDWYKKNWTLDIKNMSWVENTSNLKKNEKLFFIPAK